MNVDNKVSWKTNKFTPVTVDVANTKYEMCRICIDYGVIVLYVYTVWHCHMPTLRWPSPITQASLIGSNFRIWTNKCCVHWVASGTKFNAITFIYPTNMHPKPSNTGWISTAEFVALSSIRNRCELKTENQQYDIDKVLGARPMRSFPWIKPKSWKSNIDWQIQLFRNVMDTL